MSSSTPCTVSLSFIIPLNPATKWLTFWLPNLLFPVIQRIFSPSKIASLVILSPLFQTGLMIPALVNSIMPSSSFLSNVHLMTLHPGRLMSKLTILSFRIVPSLLRTFTKPPHLPPLLTFPLLLIPLSLSPQPKLLLLPKRVASLLKPLSHSAPLSRCARRRRCFLHPPLLLLLCPPNLPLRPLLLPPYPLRCPMTPRFHLPHFFLPPPHYLPFLKGLRPPLILTCLPRPFPCLRPLYLVLIGKRRCVLYYTTLVQSQSNPLHSQCLSHAR